MQMRTESKPSKNQLANLWLEEYGRQGHCCLCGNYGIIDTRNKIYTPAGFECGDKVYCICPNGRALKKYNGPIV